MTLFDKPEGERPAHSPSRPERLTMAVQIADLFLTYVEQRDDVEAQMATWQRMLRAADDYRKAKA